jgi:hypothetical protein
MSGNEVPLFPMLGKRFDSFVMEDDRIALAVAYLAP